MCFSSMIFLHCNTELVQLYVTNSSWLKSNDSAVSQTNTRQFNSTLEAWKTNWTHSIRGNVLISHFNNPVLIGSDDDLYEEQHTLPITHNPQRLSLNTLLNFDNFIPNIYKSNENIKCVKYWKLHFCLKFTKTNIVFVP